jgi:hypothetical protein
MDYTLAGGLKCSENFVGFRSMEPAAGLSAQAAETARD